MLVLRGPQKPVEALAFSPDAMKLYAVYEGFSVVTHVWDLAAHTSVRFGAKGNWVYGEFAVHPGGRWVFCRYNATGSAVDLTNGRTRPIDISDLWDHIAIAPDGSRIVTLGGTLVSVSPLRWTACLHGWKLSKIGPRREWQRKAPANAVPNQVVFVGNDTLVTADAVPPRSPGRTAVPRQFTVRSVTNGNPRTTFGGVRRENRCPQLLGSPDGKHFVARRGQALRVWDATDWKKRPRVIAGKDDKEQTPRRAACFHPALPYFLLANHGPSVLVFDTITWKVVRRWNWKAGNLEAVAVAPDGSLAAAGSTRGAIVVWDLDL